MKRQTTPKRTRTKPSETNVTKLSLVSQTITSPNDQEPSNKPMIEPVSTTQPKKPRTSPKNRSFIVCLKINKVMYERVFNQNPETPGSSSGEPIDIFNQPTPNSENQINEEDLTASNKSLNIPRIHGLNQFDIQPEKVCFKQYSDIDEQCLNSRINNRSLSDKRIHIVLSSFKNKTWPKSSNYACWNCTEFFENAPVGIPTIISSESYEDAYYLEGNFCSHNCAARFLFDTRSKTDNQLFVVYEIMNFIYNEIQPEGSPMGKIKLAPEKFLLKKFGGPLSLEEYRKNFNDKVNYEVFKSPLIPALYHIQENMDLSKLLRTNHRKKMMI